MKTTGKNTAKPKELKSILLIVVLGVYVILTKNQFWVGVKVMGAVIISKLAWQTFMRPFHL